MSKVEEDLGLSHPLVLEGHDDAEAGLPRKSFDHNEDRDRYNMGYDLYFHELPPNSPPPIPLLPK